MLVEYTLFVSYEVSPIRTAIKLAIWCILDFNIAFNNKEDMISDLDGVITVGDFYKQGSGVGTHMLFI